MPHPLETYLEALRTARSTGAATPEMTYYAALTNLFESVGRTLDPPVVFIAHPAGASDTRPDGGFYVTNELVPDEDVQTILTTRRPSHGVVEVKSVDEDTNVTLRSRQVRLYLARYGQVLVTNYREFRLVIGGEGTPPEVLEPFTLAPDAAAFWRLAAHPQRAVRDLGDELLAYLRRAMLHAAPITAPAEVAELLAAYAKQALRKVEASRLPALANIRRSLEQALGITFEGARGEHLFRSTLVQTLWYGVFSAWVLWSRESDAADRSARFEWRMSSWSLRVPVIRAIFEMVSSPARLQPLGLTELLDWTEDVLNRVDRRAFFQAFDQNQAVQYFYEPFLEAFDPELRREMGVWYTPTEIVRYQVARVDQALREELGIEAGLADRNVYVLDPCCGTGAYLVEILRVIASTLEVHGAGATLGGRLKQAAMERIMGFEIMPAPFVVAHLQLGLLLQSVNAPLSGATDGGADSERVAVYLTNALTGWEPETGPKQHLLFEELQEEHDAAGRVKQERPILVVLGNPPYYGFAGMAVAEERSLSTAYRVTKRAPMPQGQGLNDLYVRFWRMAERRIVDRTGEGVVCFITNYSWLDKSSFTGMREHYLEVFDRLSIDNLHGDSRANGKTTPDGQPDPSVFSTPQNPEGIQVGTAVATLVRRRDHVPSDLVLYRDFWGRSKRANLEASAVSDGKESYQALRPLPELGLVFVPAEVTDSYLTWPRIVDLFPKFFPGVQTKRDDLVIDIDRDDLERRMRIYFDPSVSHEEMKRICPRAMEETNAFAAQEAREWFQKRGMLRDAIIPHTYRPFDTRWIYYEPEMKLLERHSPDYVAQVFDEYPALVTQQRARRGWNAPQVTRAVGALHLVESSASIFPLRIRDAIERGAQASLFGTDAAASVPPRRPTGPEDFAFLERWNLTDDAQRYLAATNAADDAPLLFAHTLAVLHAPAYASAHADALRGDWARVPLPADANLLRTSGRLGEEVLALLDADRTLPRATTTRLAPLFRSVGTLRTTDGAPANQAAGDLALTARWGIVQRSGKVMPAAGRLDVRQYGAAELVAFSDAGFDPDLAQQLVGDTTVDVYLNDRAYWSSVPRRVWEYEIGGYPVLRKWLSHRERVVLGRDLSLDDVDAFSAIVRRITALLLLGPALDTNYYAVLTAMYEWPSGLPQNRGPEAV